MDECWSHLGLRVRDRLGDGGRVPLREPPPLTALDAVALRDDGGGEYAHRRPLTTGAPLTPPTCTYRLRAGTPRSTSVDASGLPSHAAPASPALSLPARHPNGAAHNGQPVPTYSAVLLVVWPHVVSVSVPPSGVAGPRKSAYTRRDPG